MAGSFERLEGGSSYSNYTMAVIADITFTAEISIADVIGLEIFGVSTQIVLDGGTSSFNMFSIASSSVMFRNLTFQNGVCDPLFFLSGEISRLIRSCSLFVS